MKKTGFIMMILFAVIFSVSVCTAEDLTSGDYTYVILENGTVEITKYMGEETEIGIPSELSDLPVTSIGANAFSWNTVLRSAVIPEGVISVGNHAFSECTALESITLPESLVWLGDASFQGCILLKEAVLPAGLIRIGWNPFDRCDLITEIILPEGNPFYKVQDGVLFDRPNSRLIAYPAGLKNDAYTIPEWVTSVGMAAFSENSYLRELTIPDSLTELDGNPFCGCTSLKKISLSSLHPAFEISQSALYDKRNLTLIAYLWEKSVNTYKVQQGTIRIGQEAFYKHPELTYIDLPGSVREVEAAAFAQTGLISMRLPDSIISLGNDAFNNCANLTSVRLPAGLTILEDSVFYKCIRLRSVTLPGSIRSIGNAAFYLCQSLLRIEVPQGTLTIGDYAFAGCFSLRTVTLPESVCRIGKDVFYSADNVILTSPSGSFAEEWAKENGIKRSEPKRLPTEMI